jgi:hypothetical protein
MRSARVARTADPALMASSTIATDLPRTRCRSASVIRYLTGNRPVAFGVSKRSATRCATASSIAISFASFAPPIIGPQTASAPCVERRVASSDTNGRSSSA